jgi:hypothetical protein
MQGRKLRCRSRICKETLVRICEIAAEESDMRKRVNESGRRVGRKS